MLRNCIINFNMTKEIIAVTNDKGGVGKTTTAQNLATALMLKGHKVLVIDADSQLYASYCNGWNPKDETEKGKRTLFDALVKPGFLPVYKSGRGLYFTPSSKSMVGIDPFLNRQLSPNTVLASVLRMPVEDHTGEGIGLPEEFFDYIIIDCPPSLGSVTINMMAAATGLVIPVQLEGFSVRGLGEVTAKFKEVQSGLNNRLKIRGFLLVMVDGRLNISKEYKAGLEASFTDLLFDTCIRRNVRIPESQDSDSDIFAYDSESIGAKDYMAFTEEFLNKSPKE